MAELSSPTISAVGSAQSSGSKIRCEQGVAVARPLDQLLEAIGAARDEEVGGGDEGEEA